MQSSHFYTPFSIWVSVRPILKESPCKPLPSCINASRLTPIGCTQNLRLSGMEGRRAEKLYIISHSFNYRNLWYYLKSIDNIEPYFVTENKVRVYKCREKSCKHRQFATSWTLKRRMDQVHGKEFCCPIDGCE